MLKYPNGCLVTGLVRPVEACIKWGCYDAVLIVEHACLQSILSMLVTSDAALTTSLPQQLVVLYTIRYEMRSILPHGTNN